MSDATIAAHAPTQHNVVTDRGRRQVYCCGDKGIARGPSPRRTGSERVTTAGANCPGVGTGDKAATCGDDVRKCATINADLQHPTVKGVLQVVILAESHLHPRSDNGNDWRIETFVAYYGRIINKSGIGQRIGNRCRHPGI
jgi:hypothetical protein